MIDRSDLPPTKGKLLCGCCRRRTVIILLDGLTRLCGCDPDAARCHQCTRGRCHCRCVPALPRTAPARPDGALAGGRGRA